jgi:Alr-MurF fusion protein
VPTSLQQIVRRLGAEWLQQVQTDALVEHLSIDSRAAAPPQALFFALPGQRHDGHRYLADAYRAGVRHFAVSRRDVDLTALPDADVFWVENTLDALQQVAAQHRSQFDIPVVGITGSNGKTVVKEWLYQLLRPDFDIVRSPKSYNSQVGVPLSVWQMEAQHTLAIFEAGISQPDEMGRLAKIIRPTLGIFTTLGPAHREGFGSEREKFEEKMRLLETCSTLVVCADQGLDWPERTGRRLFSWSLRGLPADVQVVDNQHFNFKKKSLTLRWRTTPDGPLHEQVVELPFADAASVENALHCLVAGLVLGADPARLAERVSDLEPVAMRLELRAGIQNSTLVNDFYNLDLASLRIALQMAAQQSGTRRRTLILSDILQSGLSEAALHREVADLLARYRVDRLIGIGSVIGGIGPLLGPTVERTFFADTTDFLSDIGRFSFRDEVVVIKGARPFAFERVARRLEQKIHKTVLEVNLSALVHNLNVYTSFLRPGTRTLAMVKAAGYGSGAAEVARLLEFHKVDYLGVAYADEGIDLRQAGVTLPILVLNPTAASFDPMYRFRLEPEIYSHDMLDDLIDFSSDERPMNFHLKLDTGMHRLGFELGDIDLIIKKLGSQPQLRVQSIFSHLSASDAPQHDAFTHAQAARFVAMAERLTAGLGYAPTRHIANTNAIVRFAEYHFDMVRLGIGLYGVGSPEVQNRLRTVSTLRATVSQVKTIAAGESVGYNRNSGLLDQARKIATISIGYADGLLRLAGGGRYAVGIRGQLAPTIGNVCMDMTMVDVTHMADVQAGDEVVVFGEQPTVSDLARCLQSIPYEVLTNISERVKRVYVQE